mmetsp:Transcript_3836/g.17662  ORF Transcript_3836/g.17662 Transcript_3836/m.17662 type:complete len:402 (-) Transcript_3836:1328-2533(-)
MYARSYATGASCMIPIARPTVPAAGAHHVFRKNESEHRVAPSATTANVRPNRHACTLDGTRCESISVAPARDAIARSNLRRADRTVGLGMTTFFSPMGVGSVTPFDVCFNPFGSSPQPSRGGNGRFALPYREVPFADFPFRARRFALNASASASLCARSSQLSLRRSNLTLILKASHRCSLAASALNVRGESGCNGVRFRNHALHATKNTHVSTGNTVSSVFAVTPKAVHSGDQSTATSTPVAVTRHPSVTVIRSEYSPGTSGMKPVTSPVWSVRYRPALASRAPVGVPSSNVLLPLPRGPNARFHRIKSESPSASLALLRTSCLARHRPTSVGVANAPGTGAALHSNVASKRNVRAWHTLLTSSWNSYVPTASGLNCARKFRGSSIAGRNPSVGATACRY